jgi:hypothetical protein
MKKKPVGYFIDPSTQEVVAILARNKESDEEAKKRVASAHNIDVNLISDKMPEGNRNPGLIIDVPDRTPKPSDRNRDRRPEMNPSDSVHRFQARISGAPSTQASSIEGALIPSGGRMLGDPPPASHRSEGGPSE